jgi:hypothetical protein
MKSKARLTKQGIPDLNYYGPRRKPVAPVEATRPAIPDELASPVGEAAKVVETPRGTDLPPS